MSRYNVGNAASSGLGGAASGAAIGSVVPGIGTALGAGVGAVTGFFGSLFGNKQKKKKMKKLSTLDPQQQALFDDYIGSVRGNGPFSDMFQFNSNGYNDVFDQTVGRQANRNFNEKVIPGLTGQFRQSNLGNSSYLGEALSNAGRDVQENLDAQRSANIFAGQQQAQQNKQSAIDRILNTQTFAYNQPAPQQPNAVDGILGSLAPIAGDWIADYMRDARRGVGSTPSASSPAIPAATGGL